MRGARLPAYARSACRAARFPRATFIARPSVAVQEDAWCVMCPVARAGSKAQAAVVRRPMNRRQGAWDDRLAPRNQGAEAMLTLLKRVVGVAVIPVGGYVILLSSVYEPVRQAAWSRYGTAILGFLIVGCGLELLRKK